MNLTERLLASHLVDEDTASDEIALRIDQTLTQDSTGTMCYMQLEALGVDRVRTELSVAYVDHNTLQTGPLNAMDHKYLRTVAARHGIWFSPPGNGICHQIHLEQFAAPGKTLLGSDSHTPTCGAVGMLAIGAGGMEVAAAMAGAPLWLKRPSVTGIRLSGALRPWVSAKDVALHLLGILGVTGGAGSVFEYFGDGVGSLDIYQRATICNMGAELGAVSSVFPSDEMTRQFLRARGRERDWVPLTPAPHAAYHRVYNVELHRLVPLVALHGSPDNVVPVSRLAGRRVDQVIIGSCTNSSYRDVATAAWMLEGKRVHPDVEVALVPGSRRILSKLAASGALSVLISAGVRILESACGPCIGMGLSPGSGAVSLRTFNRNFPGRSGTPDAEVWLSGVEVAVASAISGVITDPRQHPAQPPVIQDHPEGEHILCPPCCTTEVVRGPNIKPFPVAEPPGETLRAQVIAVLGDNVSTDDIMPSHSKLLPYRSNIPALAEHCLEAVSPGFSRRALDAGRGIIVAGDNYGQGSSREHAALAPLYLGIRAVLARSFARIHRTNLINNGILPLVYNSDPPSPGDLLEIRGLRAHIACSRTVGVHNLSTGGLIPAHLLLTAREREVLLAGGYLNWVKAKGTRDGAAFRPQ
ncbi:MAG: aconitate hydratase [Bacillota bacterium]